MNKKARGYLSYSWYWYLLIAVTVGGAFYGIYTAAHALKNEEKLEVFVAAKFLEKEKMASLLKQEVEDKAEAIKSYSFDYYDPASSYYSSVFQTRGLVDADLIVLPEGQLDSRVCPSYFAAISLEENQDYLPSETGEAAEYEGITYGLSLGSRWKDLGAFSEGKAYFVFLNKHSDKLGALKQGSANDAGLYALGALAS